MTGQYEYIFRQYGVRPAVGGRVEHTVTGEFGTILKEAETHKHYVRVRFDGCDQPGLCHPLELDFLAPDERECRPLASITIEVHRDWAHFERLIDDVLEELRTSAPSSSVAECPTCNGSGKEARHLLCRDCDEASATSTKGNSDE